MATAMKSPKALGLRDRVEREVPELRPLLTNWRRVKLDTGTLAVEARVDRKAWPQGPGRLRFFEHEIGDLVCHSFQADRVKVVVIRAGHPVGAREFLESTIATLGNPGDN